MTQHVTGDLLSKLDDKFVVPAEILLIEDEPLVSALIRRYVGALKEAPVDKTGASFQLPPNTNILSLDSGFDLLKSDLSKVKIAVVDILLPQVTGVDLIRDFRRRFPNMGIIPISGMATDHMKRQLRDVLPEELKLLSKPLRKEEFYEAFARAWNFFEKSKNSFEMQQRQQGPSLAKEGDEELWTAVNVNHKPKAAVTVEKRGLHRKKVAA